MKRTSSCRCSRFSSGVFSVQAPMCLRLSPPHGCTLCGSYFQFVSFALNLRVQWPTTLRQIFEVQRSTSSPDGLFVSLDCALAATDSGGVARAASFFGDGETADAFLQQELLYLCVPFIGAAIIASFWWGCMFPYRACCRKYEVRSVRVRHRGKLEGRMCFHSHYRRYLRAETVQHDG